MGSAIRETKTQVERHIRRLDITQNEHLQKNTNFNHKTKNNKTKNNKTNAPNKKNIKNKPTQNNQIKEDKNTTSDNINGLESTVAEQHDGHELLQIVDQQFKRVGNEGRSDRLLVLSLHHLEEMVKEKDNNMFGLGGSDIQKYIYSIMNWAMTGTEPMLIVFSTTAVTVYDALEKRIKSRFNNAFIDLRKNSITVDLPKHFITCLTQHKENYLKIKGNNINPYVAQLIDMLVKLISDSV